MTIWGWTGFAVVIYLAALQGVPQTLLEAAAIDGAGPWRTFRRVTLPLLSPASLFLAVWLTINALQLFDEVYLSTSGRPAQRDHGPRLLPLRAGVPALQLRLRVRHRLLPVPHHHRGHRRSSSGSAGDSRTTGHDRDLGARPRRSSRRGRRPRAGAAAAAVQPVAPGAGPGHAGADLPVRLAAHHLGGDPGRGAALPADPDPARAHGSPTTPTR